MKNLIRGIIASVALGCAFSALAERYDVTCRYGNVNLNSKAMWRSKAAYKEAVKAKCPSVLIYATWTNDTLVCISPKFVKVKPGQPQPANAPKISEPLADIVKVFPKKTKLLFELARCPGDTKDTSLADAFDKAIKGAKIDPKNVTVLTWSPEGLVPFRDKYPEYRRGLYGLLSMDNEKRCDTYYEAAKKVEPAIAIFDWVQLEDCVREDYLAKYRDELKMEFGMYSVHGNPETFKSGLKTLRPKTIYAPTPHVFCENAKSMFPGDSFSVK